MRLFRRASIFQSTPLMRGETTAIDRLRAFEPFQSTPLTRGETRHQLDRLRLADISIRSPHARGDGRKRCKRCSIQISIHSPHTRGDKQEDGILTWEITFQSTPLTRGETSAGEQIAGSDSISIHSPHARGDYSYLCLYRQYRAFQSTPLMRGETPSLTQKGSASKISIHSPHARGDRCFANRLSALWHFNPLPSCEGRPKSHTRTRSRLKFQSTPLMRGETRVPNRVLPKILISIHSPHARGDSISLQKSIRIYVSLHNKTMIHRFSELYKPLFAAQSPIFGVRSPRKSHDSFTFARLSEGHGITP